MNLSFLGIVLYILPLVFVLMCYQRHCLKKEKRSKIRLKEAKVAGLTEPPSLHPIIGASQCIGCGACIPACPEKALALVNGKGVLVEPAHCIGEQVVKFRPVE